MLRPSGIPGAGVGVFALHDIGRDTRLNLFRKEEGASRKMKEEDVSEELRTYCIALEGGMWDCPPSFNRMSVGWYLNHSRTPNAAWKKDAYYSIRRIARGDELTIDYNRFDEPPGKKEAYYAR